MGVKLRRKGRKKYQYRANPKRKLNEIKRLFNPAIQCMPVKKAWNNKKGAPANIADMGLVFDLDRDVPVQEKNEHTAVKSPKNKRKEKPTEVVQKLKEHVNKRSGKPVEVRLTNAQVEYATLMLDKYGFDYKAMARDPRNYFQDTWKQIRVKIQLFTSNPRYFVPYARERGMLKPENLEIQDKEEKIDC